MHIVLLAAEGRSPTEIARILFCSRTTVYAVVGRFLREGRAAFDDRNRRGPKPLLEELEREYIERLVEEDSPTEHGWLRSRWSCKLLTLELFKERATLLSQETLRRASSPGLSLEKATSGPARERLQRAKGAKAQEALGRHINDQRSRIVFPGRDQA
jgi:transposase